MTPLLKVLPSEWQLRKEADKSRLLAMPHNVAEKVPRVLLPHAVLSSAQSSAAELSPVEPHSSAAGVPRMLLPRADLSSALDVAAEVSPVVPRSSAARVPKDAAAT